MGYLLIVLKLRGIKPRAEETGRRRYLPLRAA